MAIVDPMIGDLPPAGQLHVHSLPNIFGLDESAGRSVVDVDGRRQAIYA
ncbi:hypothetical protein [Micromonospora qiuiae]|nr:hypothetical protein [Micromonospora qiuiae]